jgi:hypothetical protein
MTLYICSKCKALVEINPLNAEARYITEKYDEIDSVTGRVIEILCPCKNPLTLFEDYIEETKEDIVIDYIINQSMKDYQTPEEKMVENIEDQDLRDLKPFEHN